MKMPDGGFRPGYNVQLAVAGSPMGGPRTVVGLRVNNVGSDQSSITPMLVQIKTRTGVMPTTLLADANHATHGCIEYAAQSGVEALVAVPKHEKSAYVRMPSADVAAWRARMESEKRSTRVARAQASAN